LKSTEISIENLKEIFFIEISVEKLEQNSAKNYRKYRIISAQIQATKCDTMVVFS